MTHRPTSRLGRLQDRKRKPPCDCGWHRAPARLAGLWRLSYRL